MSIAFPLSFHFKYLTLPKKITDMKARQVCWAVMAIALTACSGSNKSLGNDTDLLGNLPIVAQSVEVGGEKMAVCELNLLKDTIDLPLSYWVDDLVTVKLDGKDEALVGQGPVCVSENYILVGRANNVPCKLFRRDGSFVGKVGNIGQGPGEYTMIYDMQIDEQTGHVYLLPWNAKSIFVYDMKGQYLKDIPLNKKYEKMIVPKGKFKVDAARNRVAVMKQLVTTLNYENRISNMQQTEHLTGVMNAGFAGVQNRLDAGFQGLQDYLTSEKIDGLRQKITTLENAANNANQTAAINAYVNAAVTPVANRVTELMARIPPLPVPAYPAPQYANNYTFGVYQTPNPCMPVCNPCGCGNGYGFAA